MKDHDKIKKVSRRGHTSSEGDAAPNKKLSEDRAAAVMKALVDRGIDKGRLTSKGFGVTSRSATTRRKKQGQDRRVEFTITDPARPVAQQRRRPRPRRPVVQRRPTPAVPPKK